jgi:ribose 5-phosphate isomerase B
LRIALGSDERSHLTEAVEADLRRRGHEVILEGPLKGDAQTWPDVARAVAESVVNGVADQGVLFCWTGTGVSMAANKVPGIRAALCGDAETARGARAWNQANVLCMSLRGTSEIVATEILDAWFSASADPSETENVARLTAIDEEYRPTAPPRRGGERQRLSGGRTEAS